MLGKSQDDDALVVPCDGTPAIPSEDAPEPPGDDELATPSVLACNVRATAGDADTGSRADGEIPRNAD